MVGSKWKTGGMVVLYCIEFVVLAFLSPGKALSGGEGRRNGESTPTAAMGRERRSLGRAPGTPSGSG